MLEYQALAEIAIRNGFLACVIVYLLHERSTVTQELVEKIENMIHQSDKHMSQISAEIKEMCASMKIMLLQDNKKK